MFEILLIVLLVINGIRCRQKTYYEILGLDRSCTAHDIKKNFRKLAKIYHPDKNKSPDAEEKFKEITKAHDVLSNAEQKRLYDQLGHEEFIASANRGGGMHEHHGGGFPFGSFHFSGFGGGSPFSFFSHGDDADGPFGGHGGFFKQFDGSHFGNSFASEFREERSSGGCKTTTERRGGVTITRTVCS